MFCSFACQISTSVTATSAHNIVRTLTDHTIVPAISDTDLTQTTLRAPVLRWNLIINIALTFLVFKMCLMTLKCTTLTDWLISLECDAPYYGQGCSYMCECGAGMDRCDPVKGCVCLPGWTGSDCSQDVNECSVNQSICGTDKLCHNLQGGYRCDCRQGYRKEAAKCVGMFMFL